MLATFYGGKYGKYDAHTELIGRLHQPTCLKPVLTNFRVVGFQGFRASGFQGFRILGLQGFRVLGKAGRYSNVRLRSVENETNVRN
eukprot:6788517-Pyramimonas_sp.AAC.1